MPGLCPVLGQTMTLHITTPFGRRSLTPAQIHAQVNADGCPRGTCVHKWTVFRDIATARLALGLGDRALAVLDALLTFHPETALSLDGGPALVVYPSNAALGLRAHGIAEATLRRALAALVEAGLIIRRDSPNGKRYVRRGPGGAVAQAFGFDLSPLVARAAELAALAEAVRARALALRVARERVTLLRRDCVKLIQGLAEAAPDLAGPLRTRYEALVAVLPRTPDLDVLEDVGAGLAELATDLGKWLIARTKTPEASGSPDQGERHEQSSDSDDHDSEPATGPGRDDGPVPEKGRGARGPRPAPPDACPLGLVLEACPDILAYARDGVRSWRDLVAVTRFVRPMMGISPDAWRDACAVMGEEAAAVTVAAILQRAAHIRSPGGYLRALVDRRRSGRFSLEPVLRALQRERLRSGQVGA
jgi:replication initiation protein RepC